MKNHWNVIEFVAKPGIVKLMIDRGAKLNLTSRFDSKRDGFTHGFPLTTKSDLVRLPKNPFLWVYDESPWAQLDWFQGSIRSFMSEVWFIQQLKQALRFDILKILNELLEVTICGFFFTILSYNCHFSKAPSGQRKNPASLQIKCPTQKGTPR